MLLGFFFSFQSEERKMKTVQSHRIHVSVYAVFRVYVCVHVYYSSYSFLTNLLNNYEMVTCSVARRYQELFWLYTVGQTGSSALGQVPVSQRSSTDQPAPRVYCPHSLMSHLTGLTCKYLRLNPH